MFAEYHKETGVKVNYQAIGSGGGIKQVMSKVVDFGGTDAYLDDAKLSEAKEAILHIPTCLGAVAVTYNLPGNPQLKLTGGIIADIFMGNITRWDDARIQKLNNDVKLPGMRITVVRRSDSSGTTFIFTDYLSKVSPEWEKNMGRSKTPAWGAYAIGAAKNAGVAGQVKNIPGSVGYVEVIYALSNGMPVASVQNRSGSFVAPTLEGVGLAADIDMPADTRVTITDTKAAKGYPISSFTWVIFYKEQNYGGRTLGQARETLNLLWWMIHDGQRYNEELKYGRLPAEAVKKAEAVLRSARYNGKPILK
jgi:phosphate transport system substrate-binding protein